MKPLNRLSPAALPKPQGLSKPLPVRKPLQTLEPAPDPIEGQVDYTGQIDTDAAAELGAVEKGFRERMREEADRFKGATASDFYTCVVFDDGEQCTAFLKALGLDKGGDLFVDGRVLADKLGIELPKSQLNTAAPRKSKIDPKLTRLAGIPKK